MQPLKIFTDVNAAKQAKVNRLARQLKLTGATISKIEWLDRLSLHVTVPSHEIIYNLGIRSSVISRRDHRKIHESVVDGIALSWEIVA